jgi:hypothetical protein
MERLIAARTGGVMGHAEAGRGSVQRETARFQDFA